jgi:hypothetical protein
MRPGGLENRLLRRREALDNLYTTEAEAAMTAYKVVALGILAGVSACTPLTRNPSRFIKHENGPKGSVHANYSGGLVMRTVNVAFRVEQDAYVMIGHLSGDGVIRVIYPESPQSDEGLFNPVTAKRTMATQAFFASYDGAPSLHSFRMNPFRGINAMMDSYDGRGHGYIFMVATHSPMYYERITEDDVDWSEITVRDYDHLTDPRLAIRDFAETVAGGRYTLEFASSHTSYSVTSYAAMAWDCSLLNQFGYDRLAGFWGSWGLAGFWPFAGHSSSFSRGHGCGRSFGAYAFNNFYNGDRYGYDPYGYDPYGPRQYVPVVYVPATPDTTTPVMKRAKYRPLTEGGPGIGRSVLGRPAPRAASLVRLTNPWPTSDGLRSSPRSDVTRRPLDRSPSYGQRSDGPRSVAREHEARRSSREQERPRAQERPSATRERPSATSSGSSGASSAPAPRASAPESARPSSSKPTPPNPDA